MKRKWRLYLDTSVFGGCFDAREGWDADSLRVMGYIFKGTAELLTSEVVEVELAGAPQKVRELYAGVPDNCRRILPVTAEAEELAGAYLDAGVVSRRWEEDCLHVALATLALADAIVSWNFKHIVRMDRIRAFNAVNVAEGYAMMQIVSPKEVNLDDD
jgi:hypothetical protein